MSLVIAMLIAYIPFFFWIWQEIQDQLKESNKTH